MSRYNRINIARNDNENVANIGAQYYISNFYPTIPLSSNDIYVITEFSDRLDTLANRFYGDSNLYWIIASANPDLVSGDSLFLAGGIQLRIPTNVNSILTNYNISNGIGTSVAASPSGVGGVSAGASGVSSVSGGGGGGGGGGGY
jgi:hypothetical protein